LGALGGIFRPFLANLSNSESDVVSLDVLNGPRLKANRADKHINELIRVTRPLDSAFYRLAVEPRTIPPYADGTFFNVTYCPLKPIAETLALIIGDAVHNLRAALDHFASTVIRTNDPSAKPYFPVTKDRQHLHRSGVLAQLESALPGSTRLLLDKIRPIDSATDHLWAFGSLDIDDKHNLIIPTVTVVSIDAVIGVHGHPRHCNVSVGNDAARPFVALTGPMKFTIDDPKATVHVSFSGGTPFDGKSVIPTLLDIRNLVAETLDAFGDLIAGNLSL
jgi:hypothetical protein